MCFTNDKLPWSSNGHIHVSCTHRPEYTRDPSPLTSRGMAICDGTICDSLQFVTVARFVTTECFNLWPGTICDQKCFNLWLALYNDFRVQVVQGKTCFSCLHLYCMQHGIIWCIYIYELCYNTYINSGARSLMLFYINTIWISFCHIHIISHICVSYFMRRS